MEYEYSLYDILDFAYRWRLLYALAILVSIVTGVMFYNFQPKITQVSTTVTVYPAIPGMTAGAASAELADRILSAVPGVVATDTGFAISVTPSQAEMTSKTMATTIDKFDTQLRERLAKAKAEAEADYKENPSNSAVYQSVDRYRMLPDTMRLVHHAETITPRVASLKSRIIQFVGAGLLLSFMASLGITVMLDWRKHWRALNRNTTMA